MHFTQLDEQNVGNNLKVSHCDWYRKNFMQSLKMVIFEGYLITLTI